MDYPAEESFSGRPFTEYVISPEKVIRIFSKTIDENELVWHRDVQDRELAIIEGKDWMLQLENCLPIQLKETDKYKIEGMTYHRLIRGTTDLVVEILEKNADGKG